MLIKQVALVTILTLILSACNTTQRTSKPQSKLQSSPKTTVYYAGFGYLGSGENNENKFANAIRINKEKKNNVGKLTRELSELLTGSELDYINVDFSNVNQNQQRPLMMALSVERENLAFNALNQPIAEVFVQALFFDYNTRTLVSSVGFFAQRVHYLKTSSKFNSNEMFDELYLYQQDSVLAKTIEKLKNHNLVDKNQIRFQVTNVNLADTVKNQLPKTLSIRTIKDFIAQTATVEFSENDWNMIPHTRGETIGRQMAFRLIDASGFSMQLPPPDYEWHIDLLKTNMIAVPNRGIDLYAAEMQIKLIHTPTNKIVLDIPLRRATSVIRNENVKLKDTWAPREDAIRLAIKELSEQFPKPSNKWCKNNSNGADACKQIKKIAKTIYK